LWLSKDSSTVKEEVKVREGRRKKRTAFSWRTYSPGLVTELLLELVQCLIQLVLSNSKMAS
jgi:hypothetical protein